MSSDKVVNTDILVVGGGMGGLFAAFFPVVTGGIGGFLAGHATAQRDDRLFIISQGASKVVYYVGGFLLFFVPGLHLTRGGMAWMLSTLYSAHTPASYFLATAGVVLAGSRNTPNGFDVVIAGVPDRVPR